VVESGTAAPVDETAASGCLFMKVATATSRPNFGLSSSRYVIPKAVVLTETNEHMPALLDPGDMIGGCTARYGM